MIIRSSIKSSLKSHYLVRGTLLATLGALLMAIAGVFMSPQELSLWGLPIFLIAVGLITAGLLPYKRLCQLEKKPNEIQLNAKNIQYLNKGKITLTIPLGSIKRISYIQAKERYGIAIWLNKPVADKVMVHQPKYKPQKISFIRCDIFLPYFSEYSCTELVNEVYGHSEWADPVSPK